MGGVQKLLLPYGASTVLGSLVATLRAAGVGDVVLVVAAGDAELAAFAADHDLRLAVNPAPRRGMLSSVWAGLETVMRGATPPPASPAMAHERDPETVLLVTPGDLPALAPSSVEALVAARAAAEVPLAVPSYRGRRGHPLAIARRLWPEIASLDLDAGLRQLLARHPDELLEVPVEDPGVIADVDTREDYARLAPAAPRTS